MAEKIDELEKLFEVARTFVEEHYKTSDERDKNIKILATINQLIELKKLENSKGLVAVLSKNPIKLL